MTNIERVARAMFTHQAPSFTGPWEKASPSSRKYWLWLASVAVEAMQSPSEESTVYDNGKPICPITGSTLTLSPASRKREAAEALFDTLKEVQNVLPATRQTEETRTRISEVLERCAGWR